MRVITSKKISLLLVGLPRSGTTISAKFLNSFENSFFLEGALLEFFEEGRSGVHRQSSV